MEKGGALSDEEIEEALSHPLTCICPLCSEFVLAEELEAECP